MNCGTVDITYDENCIVTLGTDGEHAVNVVVSDYLDLVFLAKGYARRMMKITPSDVRAIVSGSPRRVMEVFQAV